MNLRLTRRRGALAVLLAACGGLLWRVVFHPRIHNFARHRRSGRLARELARREAMAYLRMAAVRLGGSFGRGRA